MKNVDSKKLAGTIIGGIAFIFCLIFFTYAWYEWRSNNTELSGEITDNAKVDITLDNDGDISSNDIGPVLNIEDGVIGGFSADNKDVYPGHLYIDLKINIIDSELLSEDLKYIIVKSIVSPRTDDTIDKSTLTYDYDNPVASGDFSNFKVATNLLGEDNVQAQSITFYKVIIYIDGNVPNNTNLQGKSIDAKLIITDTEIKYLNEVPVGSYVEYVGNNGCEGDSCKGVNANYESGVTNGYCSDSSHTFASKGWRIAYTKEGNTHIVTAGSPECLCTNSDGTTSNTSCDTHIESSDDIQLHLDNLNEVALKYCNTEYSQGGVCDSSTTWAMKEEDFRNITTSNLNSCILSSTPACGLGNELIDNTGYYWYATPYDPSYEDFMIWAGSPKYVMNEYSNNMYGVRPIIKLDKNVVITGGKGTASNPYKIEKIEPEGTIATTYVQSLYDSNKATSYHIGGYTTKPTVNMQYLNEEGATDKWGIMLDNNGEYRYYGKNPNNYVSFNGELWRIISSSNVYSSKEDTTGSQRLRIIRADSIGYHVWDYGTDGTDYDNNWENATLNTTLNGIYYNRTSGICYTAESATDTGTATTCDYSDNGTIKGLSSEARSLIDDAVWYLGGSDTFRRLYACDYYNFERGLPNGYILPSTDYPETVTAKLGIMYPSDYTYAADLSLCKKDGYSYDNDEINCLNTDWLFNGEYQWLVSTGVVGSYYSWLVRSSGYVDGSYGGYNGGYDVDDALGARPLVVLKPNVMITGGTGTSGDPYTLAQ